MLVVHIALIPPPSPPPWPLESSLYVLCVWIANNYYNIILLLQDGHNGTHVFFLNAYSNKARGIFCQVWIINVAMSISPPPLSLSLVLQNENVLPKLCIYHSRMVRGEWLILHHMIVTWLSHDIGWLVA